MNRVHSSSVAYQCSRTLGRALPFRPSPGMNRVHTLLRTPLGRAFGRAHPLHPSPGMNRVHTLLRTPLGRAFGRAHPLGPIPA